jgi:hypothetical protein
MIRPIMKDIFFLNQKSEPATKADDPVVQDLLDTLKEIRRISDGGRLPFPRGCPKHHKIPQDRSRVF